MNSERFARLTASNVGTSCLRRRSTRVPLSSSTLSERVRYPPCHFLGQRALLFRLFTAFSSPGVSRSRLVAARSRRTMQSCCRRPPVGNNPSPRPRGLVPVLPRSRQRSDGRLFAQASVNSTARFVAMTIIFPPPSFSRPC